MSKKLLFSVTIKDCEIQTFRTGGPGGQKQNKTSSGVRVIHRPSGARGESREYAEQSLNKKTAFGRMARSKQFQGWLKIQSSKLMGEKSIDELVDEQMHPEKIKTEVKDVQNRWVEGEPKE